MFVQFTAAKGRLPDLTFLPSSAATIEPKPLPGQAPFWGTFRLSFKGASTNPLYAYATAAEVQAELNGLATIGGTTVGLEYLGAGGLYPVYTVTFDGQCSSAVSSWALCPAMLGDLPALTVDSSGLLWPSAAVEAPGAPSVSVLEIVKGTPGNKVTSNADLSTVSLSMSLTSGGPYAIGMKEKHSILCNVSAAAAPLNSAASVTITFGSTSPLTVAASIPLSNLQGQLQTLTGDLSLTVVASGPQVVLCATSAVPVVVTFVDSSPNVAFGLMICCAAAWLLRRPLQALVLMMYQVSQ